MPNKYNRNILLAILIAVAAILGAIIFFWRCDCANFGKSESTFAGFIRSASISEGEIAVDDVQFLSGDEARRIGAEDSGCAPEKVEECIPSMNNDFYIRNISTSTVLYDVDKDAEIEIFASPGSPVLESVTREELFARFPRDDQFMTYFPFDITARGSKIIRMKEIYLP